MNLNLDQINKKMEGYNTLGRACWWSMQDILIKRSKLIEIFNQLDLSEEYLPADIKDVQAFRKAIQKLQAKIGKRMLVRKVLEDDDRLVYEIVKEAPDEQELKNNYDSQNLIVYRKDQGKIETRSGEHYDEFMSYYNSLQTRYNSKDIRSLLLSILKDHLNAISIRPSGGVYFVLKAYVPELEKLKEAVQMINRNSYLDTIQILDTENEKESLKRSMFVQITTEIERYKEDIQNLKTRKVREGTIKARLDKFNEIRKMASCYVDALDFNMKSINKHLQDLEKDVRELV